VPLGRVENRVVLLGPPTSKFVIDGPPGIGVDKALERRRSKKYAAKGILL
jgi:hypothetical protein